MTHPNNTYPLVDGELDVEQKKRAAARQASAFARGDADELPKEVHSGTTAVQDARVQNGLPAEGPLPSALSTKGNNYVQDPGNPAVLNEASESEESEETEQEVTAPALVQQSTTEPATVPATESTSDGSDDDSHPVEP